MEVYCTYCGKQADYIDSKEHYNNGYSYGMLYKCTPCGAWVGVHKGTNVPFGTLANKELRQARMYAHSLIDPLWKKLKGDKRKHRSRLYKIMAKHLFLTNGKCHIGLFDIETCRRVAEVLDLIKADFRKHGKQL